VAWAHTAREHTSRHGLADVLEAAALIQVEDVRGARELLDNVETPCDEWFACSPVLVEVLRAHVDHLEGRVDAAYDAVAAAFAAEPYAPDVWGAFARLCGDTDFDPATTVQAVPDARVTEVLALLRGSEPAGVDRIAEVFWSRTPNDPRVLAAAARFAAELDTVRAMEWAVRLRAAGDHTRCPLVARANDRAVGPIERLRAAVLAYESFADARARAALEDAITALEDDQLARVLDDVRGLAPELSDSVVLAGATSTARSLRLVTALWCGDAQDEAYAVLVHGLSVDDAAALDTETFAALVPPWVLEPLAEHAAARGDVEVATILWSVAAWTGQSS
jgi:hypothetical protein